MESKVVRYLPKKNQWIVVLLIGILLVVIAIPTKTVPETMENYSSNVEIRLENMLQKIEGVGKVSVMITFRESEQVEGIVVIAEGAKNAVMVQKITEVVQALFDVDSHKIKVIEGNQNN